MSSITASAPATTIVTDDGSNARIPLVGSFKGKIERQHVKLMRPTPKDTPMPEMRKRLQEDGYLLVKNLLPREEVINVRSRYFAPYEPEGLLKVGTSPADGIFDDTKDPLNHTGIGGGDLPPSKEQLKILTDAHTESAYLKLLEHSDLRGFVRDIMGWDKEVLLKRAMLRHNIPGGHSTGVHYDKLFLRHGDAFFLTAWVPIGDISVNGGGLMYLSKSPSLGRSIEDDFNRRAADFTDEERRSAFNVNMQKFGMLSQNAAEFHEQHQSQDNEEGKYWLVTPYEAGDVVFHDPYTIHASTKNEDPEGRMRLGTDLRFYREGSDLDERWTKDFWRPGDGL